MLISSSPLSPFLRKLVILQKDKNYFNCALLLNTVFMLRILLYRIGNGENKLFVFVQYLYL
jgi:hypothetical protein